MWMEAWMLSAAGWIFAPICSGLVIALREERKKRREDQERTAAKDSKVEQARIIIEKASARAHILSAYEKCIINGEHLTIARYEELLEEYEAYTLLGGNGTAKRYMEEIKALKPYLVID